MAKRRTNPESAVQKACMELLTLKGIFHWRNNNHGTPRFRSNGQIGWSFHGTPGVADIIAICPDDGRLLAIEVKAGKNTESDAQKEFLDNIRANNGHAVTVWSANDLLSYLEDHGY